MASTRPLARGGARSYTSWLSNSPSSSSREELRLHSRYIRDYLAPMLANAPELPPSEIELLRSIIHKVEPVSMTLDLLRYSRLEKAMMLIVESEATNWPLDIVKAAEDLLKRWEETLGSVLDLRADFFGPGGRLEGLKDVDWTYNGQEADAATSTTPIPPNLSRPYSSGHVGFEPGDWFLTPLSAAHAGLIAHPPTPITATPHLATAILLTGAQETPLPPHDGTRLHYHAPPHDPHLLKLCRTFASVPDKAVRLLRSWRLRSPFAPHAGLRYDGLYQIQAYGVKLGVGERWHYTFELARLGQGQAGFGACLRIPCSDQIDDWSDYRRLMGGEVGSDLYGGVVGVGEVWGEGGGEEGAGRGRLGSGDSGYFSRGPGAGDGEGGE